MDLGISMIPEQQISIMASWRPSKIAGQEPDTRTILSRGRFRTSNLFRLSEIISQLFPYIR